jgi:dihydropyrimidine dehydrogenase (NADP+)
VCSAVQNQDFTVVADYCTGLQTLLYLKGIKSLRAWDGQSPPVPKHQLGKPLVAKNSHIPNFGKFREQKKEIEKKILKSADLLDVSSTEFATRPDNQPEFIPTIKDIIGAALNQVGSYGELDNTKQKVALIDDDLCINCGKCYMTCNDSGYQAIAFDPVTHFPHVNDDCTGCTLCYSVCPIPECIQMVPRQTAHKPKRGIPPKSESASPAQAGSDGKVILLTN